MKAVASMLVLLSGKLFNFLVKNSLLKVKRNFSEKQLYKTKLIEALIATKPFAILFKPSIISCDILFLSCIFGIA